MKRKGIRNYQIQKKNGGEKKYPYAIKSWDMNWDVLSPFFKYPIEIRKIMYTTNIIEGLHRQFRKVTKTKSVFPTDLSLEKNAISSKSKCYEKMDPEIQKLGLYSKSTDDIFLKEGQNNIFKIETMHPKSIEKLGEQDLTGGFQVNNGLGHYLPRNHLTKKKNIFLHV